MSIQRLLILALLLLSGITLTLLITSNSDAPAPNPPIAESPKQTADQTPAPPPAVSPPQPVAPTVPLQPPAPVITDLPPPESESDEEEAATEKEQVDAALAQLASPEAEQRIEGAEQLGAYPTKEAEQALTQALSGDTDAEVRNTAAQSLGYVEKPTDATLAALFGALEDQNEDVRGSALSSLEDFLLGSDEGSKRYKKLLAGLQARLDSRSVSEDTRTAIRDILQDLTAPAQ